MICVSLSKMEIQEALLAGAGHPQRHHGLGELEKGNIYIQYIKK